MEEFSMGKVIPIRSASTEALNFVVGRDKFGRWIVTEVRGLYGGIFANRDAAVRFRDTVTRVDLPAAFWSRATLRRINSSSSRIRRSSLESHTSADDGDRLRQYNRSRRARR
jgi:hypothetical protein